jgi:hypothetical protein
MGRSITKDDLLDDIISVACDASLPIEEVTYKLYANKGIYSEKTVYAKFKGIGWEKVLEHAVQRASLAEQDSEDDVQDSKRRLENIKDEKEISDDETSELHLDFDFDLEAALSIGDSPSSLSTPSIHEFAVEKGDVMFFIPDIHSPFFNRKWMIWVVKTIRQAQSDPSIGTIHVIQLGDALDLYSFGRFDRIQQVSPKTEIMIGIKPVEQMWNAIGTTKTKRYQLIGNHDARSEKFCIKNADHLRAFVPTAKTMLTFPDVFTVNNESDGILFTVNGDTDKLLAIHGYLSDSLAHVRKHGVSVVHAHTHRGGDTVFTGRFCLDCGFGGDPKAFAFGYTMSAMKKDWNCGMGRVDVLKASGRFQPRFLRYFEGE